MNLFFKTAAYGLLTVFVFTPLAIDVGAQECVPAAGEPIRLGAIFPQDNFLDSEIGDYFKGIEAMRQAMNACGGVKGRPVEWVYQPAANREEALSAASTLITEDAVPVIVGSGLLAVNEGARAIAEQLGVVYWEVTEPADPGGDWYFSVRPTNQQLGEATGRFVDEVLPNVLSRNELNIALIYENRWRGQTIAQGVLAALLQNPVITYDYTDHLQNTRGLGVQLREEKIDAVILAAFEEDGDDLWYGAQEADANVGAWIHIGGEGYRRGICERLGNTDGLIAADATGPVNPRSREQTVGEIYTQYQRLFLAEYRRAPSELADLAASGVYLLLRYVISETAGDYTPANIRDVLRSLDNHQPIGLMGEGIAFRDSDTGTSNIASAVLFQQAQGGAFCTAWPSTMATCRNGIQPFPTWRTRALAAERQTCGPQV